MIWQYLIRPALFWLPPEFAHHVSMGSFSALSKIPGIPTFTRKICSADDRRLAVQLFGIDFPNCIGLAAGFDKNAKWFNALAGLGFGHVEVGTITGQPQSGNPKPRLFRLPKDKALINRMGFNNPGAVTVARQLRGMKKKTVLGINIGKSKIVSVESAFDDYCFSLQQLFPMADYLTVNVSSPNTANLRQLQNREQLLELLSAVSQLNQDIAKDLGEYHKPILLKIAPDLNHHQLDDIVDIVLQTELAGIIATNTTIARDGLKTNSENVKKIGDGGLSGHPLKKLSLNVVSHLYSQLNGRIPIIGVGGISSGEDAWDMITAGANMVQVYTGFIYGGPGFVRNIAGYLLERLTENDYNSIQQAVGTVRRSS